MTAPPLCCLHLVFSCNWKMCTTCYSRASQQPLSQAQTHISWSSECVGGHTPFHLITAGMCTYMCVNFSASFCRQLPSYVCLNRLLTERGIYQHHFGPPTRSHNATRCSAISQVERETDRVGDKEKNGYPKEGQSKGATKRVWENISATTQYP